MGTKTIGEPGVAQGTYDAIACRRNSAWTAQSIVEQGAGLNVANSDDQPPMHSPEAWWYYQGRAEAFAEAMTLLERDGLAGVILVVSGGPS